MNVLRSVFALSTGGADSDMGTVAERTLIAFIPNSVSSEIRARLLRTSVYLL